MLLTPQLFPQVIPWIFLVITIISTFVKPRLWPLLLGGTLVTGIIYNTIDIVGITCITIFLAMPFYTNKTPNKSIKAVISALVIISCIALAAHLIPGFNNFQVLSNATKGIHSTPFSLYLNFDKPLILFILLLLYPAILINNKPVTLFKKLNSLRLSAIVVFSFILLFGLATLLSLINYEPQLPSWWLLFALNNLLLTCVVEEVFFRGFIQQKLANLLNPLSGLIIASFLFGIAHYSGGFNYVIVATLAGFFIWFRLFTYR